MDEYYVLDFHRLREILAAAAPAKEHLRRQLDRVLASQTLETEALPLPVAAEPTPSLPRVVRPKRRLASPKRLPPASEG